MEDDVKVTFEKTRVKVAIRCRPALKSDLETDNKSKANNELSNESESEAIMITDSSIKLTQTSGKSREFIYDHVFGPPSTQDDIFEAVAQPVVDNFLSGKNGTLFTYGQTGTGKVTLGLELEDNSIDDDKN